MDRAQVALEHGVPMLILFAIAAILLLLFEKLGVSIEQAIFGVGILLIGFVLIAAVLLHAEGQRNAADRERVIK